MTIYDLIPTDKGDTETPEKLRYFAYDEIKPIIPDLLTWIQDLHWPASQPVLEYLQTISEHLTDNVLDILSGNDEIWKFNVICIFNVKTGKPLDPRLLDVLKRIATNPTPRERDYSVDGKAKEVLERHL